MIEEENKGTDDSGQHIQEWSRSREYLQSEGNITDSKTNETEGKLQSSSSENIIRFIDLFAGVGGFRLGLERANRIFYKECEERYSSNNNISSSGQQRRRSSNFRCVFTNEWDKYACQTYNKNFGTDIKPTDIKDVQVKSIPAFDILCGGFPCQSFSIAGKRKGFEDTRGTMFFEICRIVKHHRPRLLFLENVKGLLNHDNGKTFEVILKSLDELGYDAEWQVLNSKHFGVPQNRERVFIIGHLRGQGGFKVFPIGEGNTIDNKQSETQIARTLSATYYKQGQWEQYIGVVKDRGKWRRVDEALCIDKHYSQGIDNHGQRTAIMIADFRNDEGLRIRKEEISPTLASRKHSETDISTMAPLIMRQPLKFLERNQKEIEGDYAFTVDGANTGGIKEGSKIRRLTPIECERLQGFPDNWTDGVSDTQRYKQMGNAVTVNVIEAIGKKILEGWN